MVANVWKVVVTEGDDVAEGDTLVHPRVDEDGDPRRGDRRRERSPRSDVQEGGVVQEGDVIAVID